jgi:uncharacterized membrane protein
MEGLLFVCLGVVVWWVKVRLRELEERIDAVSRPVPRVAERPQEPARSASVDRLATGPQVGNLPHNREPRDGDSAPEMPSHVLRTISGAEAPRELDPTPQHIDWEAVVGGNWLNKVGVFVLVIGIALALGYSYAHLGPGGRVAISLAISFAMLATGAVFERRERYRTVARGLLGGGWAALYFTVYAMQALDAARVIWNPWAGALLLLVVSAGMILHSLRYRSETVTGVAYFLGFVTLAITQATTLSVVALAPLAASLLYLAHRFGWWRFALMGLVATYATCALRGDTAAALWQAQAIFTIYWLLFEAFDVMHPHRALLPLNAVGFLALSLAKWQHDAPADIWMLVAGTAAAYVVSTAVRWRSAQWHGAAVLSAALGAVAIFLKLDHQWVAAALAIEAEAFYLAGVRLRAPFLRYLGSALFLVQVWDLGWADMAVLPARAWTPIALIEAAVFYGNRALGAGDAIWYGYGAASLAALATGFEISAASLGRVWYALAAACFAVGWSKRLPDFRYQAYGLGLLAAFATIGAPWPGLAVGAAVGYAAALCALWPEPDRLFEQERALLRFVGSLSASAMLVWWMARVMADRYLGLAWLLLAVALLELGMRNLPRELRRQSYAVAAMGAALSAMRWENGWLGLGAAAACYAIAVRARGEEQGRVVAAVSSVGTALLAASIWDLAPASAVGVLWVLIAVALLALGRRHQSCALAAAAFVQCCYTEAPVASSAIVIACLFVAQFVEKPGDRHQRPRGAQTASWDACVSPLRLYYLLLSTLMAAVVLYQNVSGSMLTVAWGLEGVALLAAGFPLRDRVLRLSGLALFGFCILKLFVWDLRHLDTLPRIFSFLVLGLILVGVSFVYTRFREHVARYL